MKFLDTISKLSKAKRECSVKNQTGNAGHEPMESNGAGKNSLIFSLFCDGIQEYHVLGIGIILYILGFLFGWSADGININTTENAHRELFLSNSLFIDQPGKLIRDIFLNNMGLNVLILIGAFSLMAFSLIIISFNAVQIGFLLKGLYVSYGVKTALMLVMPHLVFEVLSQMLSLYLAFLFLNNIILTLICRERAILLTGKKVLIWTGLLIATMLCTFLGAWAEIYITPGLL